MRNFISGIKDFFSGLNALFSMRALWSCVWIPLLINIMVYILVAGLGIYFFVDLLDMLLPGGEGWLMTLLRVILWMLFSLVVFIALLFTFFAVANLIASPFNDVLSKRYEAITSKASFKAGEELTISASLYQEVKRLILYLCLFICLFIITMIISAIPVLNFTIPLLWIVFTALMIAFEFLSFPMDRRGARFSDKTAWLKKNFLRSVGFGVAAYFSLFIPFLNFFVIPTAVVAATKQVLDVEAKEEGNRDK